MGEWCLKHPIVSSAWALFCIAAFSLFIFEKAVYRHMHSGAEKEEQGMIPNPKKLNAVVSKYGTDKFNPPLPTPKPTWWVFVDSDY